MTIWNKEELKLKRQGATHLEEPKLMIPNDGISWSSSWINVEYGAEAMNESEQDPPKSGVDLVGAW